MVANPVLAKFVKYLAHNPYWGVIHHSTETDYSAVDISKFPDPYPHEVELVEIWNGMSVEEREAVIQKAEAMI
jgi:hypothetical protein